MYDASERADGAGKRKETAETSLYSRHGVFEEEKGDYTRWPLQRDSLERIAILFMGHSAFH